MRINIFDTIMSIVAVVLIMATMAGIINIKLNINRYTEPVPQPVNIDSIQQKEIDYLKFQIDSIIKEDY